MRRSRRALAGVMGVLLAASVGAAVGTAAADPGPRPLSQIVGLQRLDWASVSTKSPNTPSWDAAADAPVGRRAGARAVYRSFFRMDLKPVAGATILQAILEQPVTSATSCETESLQVWTTGDIGPTTTWNRQPAWLTDIGPTVGSCPGQWLEVDLTQVAADALAAGRDHLTLGVRAADESDRNGYKTLSNTPVIYTTYNTPPDKPTGLGMDTGRQPCGAEPLWIPTTTPQLSATITDPDHNAAGGVDNVGGHFEWWQRPGEQQIGGIDTTTIPSGHVFSVTVPDGALLDGGTYAWRVRGFDDVTSGPWSDWCEFTVDATSPDKEPTVTSDDYPPLSTGPHGGVGVPGTFTFTANGVADVAEFRYSSNQPEDLTAIPADTLGGSATVTITPAHAGTNVLYVYSIDRAGHYSPRMDYDFFVSYGSGS